MKGSFSKEAAKKSIFKTTLQHPLTLYSGAIGFLGTLASLFFGGWPFTACAIGGFLICGVSWIINYNLRKEWFINQYFKTLQESFEKKNKELMENIKNVLSSSKILSSSGNYGKQGSQQYEKIQAKYETLNRILGQKLNPGEVTHRRFLGVAEQVYFSVLDNLQSIATILESASSIDTGYIRERMNYLTKKKNLEEADKQEIETLQQRIKLQENQFSKVNELLTRNEEAMTKLDNTTSKLATVQTAQGRATMAFDETIGELEELANQVEKYSIKK